MGSSEEVYSVAKAWGQPLTPADHYAITMEEALHTQLADENKRGLTKNERMTLVLTLACP